MTLEATKTINIKNLIQTSLEINKNITKKKNSNLTLLQVYIFLHLIISYYE